MIFDKHANLIISMGRGISGAELVDTVGKHKEDRDVYKKSNNRRYNGRQAKYEVIHRAVCG